jgi:hypothetical protein
MVSFSPIDDPTRDALDASIRHFSKLVGWATVAVAIGVAMEAVEIVHDIVAWCKRWIRTKRELTDLKAVAKVFPAGELIQPTELNPKEPKWVKRFLRCGLIIVVVGVVAEWRCGANLEDAHTALQTFDESLIADTQKEAEGLREQSEAEHLARVKIEAQVAWRRLTDGQKNDIGTNLSRFSNQGVSFWYNTADIEASVFADDIAEAVSRAKTLRVYPPAGVLEMQEGGPANLGKPIKRLEQGVFVQHTKDSKSIALAEAIVKELTVRGFDAFTQEHAEIATEVPTQAWVHVAWRPEGPQGEFKLAAERDARAKNRKAKSSQDAN